MAGMRDLYMVDGWWLAPCGRFLLQGAIGYTTYKGGHSLLLDRSYGYWSLDYCIPKGGMAKLITRCSTSMRDDRIVDVIADMDRLWKISRGPGAEEGSHKRATEEFDVACPGSSGR